MSLLVIGIVLGAVAALVGVVVLTGALCLAAAYGDELVERTCEPSTVDVLRAVGDEAGAVVIDFPTRPAA